ncbi:skin secretory protein xP2-like [Leopardus geoffroyi]|uniref:skin secretory protein xP2-like n=1 Tax=Leopardus geoffroyi TaxID=46844 RepID=UPI001E26335A|nr:skin secretory protein xP2-like [Leopardus geoffroyi]
MASASASDTLPPRRGRLEGGERRHATHPRPPRPHAAIQDKSGVPAPGGVELGGSEGGPARPTSIPSSFVSHAAFEEGAGRPGIPAPVSTEGDAGRGGDSKRAPSRPTHRSAWGLSPCSYPRTWAALSLRRGPSPAAVNPGESPRPPPPAPTAQRPPSPRTDGCAPRRGEPESDASPPQAVKHTPRLGRGAPRGFQPGSRWAAPPPPAPTPSPSRPRGTRALRKPGRPAPRELSAGAPSPSRRSAPTPPSQPTCSPPPCGGRQDSDPPLALARGPRFYCQGEGKIQLVETEALFCKDFRTFYYNIHNHHHRRDCLNFFTNCPAFTGP